jgi:uncharacterized protein YjbI with pentapeptide repeats
VKVVKPAKLPVLTRVMELGRRPLFHVATILAFPLDRPRALHDELTFWKLTGAELGERGVLDEGFVKARGEVLVCGSFFAPEGKPLQASYVRVRVGAVDKRLAVVGDRFWRGDVPTPPVPMTVMPIDWAHAYGGPKHDKNPHGKGAEPIEIDGRASHPLPNIERYGQMIRSPNERPEPAGYLPMDVTFAQRRKRGGTYDKRWFEEHFPGLPPDTDPTFFNVAPEDQWATGSFRGDEAFLIENMHPEKPQIEGSLPGLVTRCFVTHKKPDGERFVEIPLRCDTVCLFPSVGLGAVVLHGSLWIAEDDAGDIVHMVCACEDPASPRTPEHYERTLARRLDKDKGALAGLSDSDLMPDRSSGVVPNIGGADLGRWLKNDQLLMKNARRGMERRFADARASLEAEGHDPKEHGFGELPPEKALPAADDLDAIAAFAEEQFAREAESRREMAAASRDAREQARKALADIGEDYETLIAETDKGEVGPPRFTAETHFAMLASMAEEARAEGTVLADVEERLADPEYRARIEQQERGLRDMYVRFGHLQPMAGAMEPEASERTRVLVGLALEAGEGLRQRDFTGANLSGMRLAAIDFSDSFMESADLEGCDLSGAKLCRAVLAKANLRGANLAGADLSGANLGGAFLDGTIFDGADLSDAVLSRTELSGARFKGANLTGADWLEAKPGNVDFSGAQLGQCNFLKCDLGGARFTGADVAEANFVECTLDDADFSRARMEKASFVASRGERVVFRGARMRQAVLVHGSSFADADFEGADMEKVNLRGAILIGARFDGAILTGADLSESDASGASFDRALMKGCLLIRTKLADAALRGANLMDVLASKARLTGADFTGANLYRADLSRTIGDARTTFAEAEVGHVRVLPKADVPPRSTP